MRPTPLFLLALCAPACGFGGGDGDDSPSVSTHSVTGKIIDVQTGVELQPATLITSGLGFSPPVLVEGTTFSISGIPASTSFQFLATEPKAYRPTFSQTVTVEDDDVDGITIPLVSTAFLAKLASDFIVTPDPQRGILLARVVGPDGKPRAGVAASNFLLEVSGASAPKFLDENMVATPSAVVTSSSGWVVFFDVPYGIVSLTQSATSMVTLEMATAPVEPNTVTVAEIRLKDGTPPMLGKISFGKDIVPIFKARSCTGCHNPPMRAGGLNLTGKADKIYDELIAEGPQGMPRVRPGMPEQSLLLTMPSRESPADRHPNVTFASSTDLDFQKIYVWIADGAKEK